jgi:eukaryotic translation initiation factor 2C
MATLKKETTMIVGIDVTHPGPGSLRGTPSIAAVVASCEPNDFAQYPCSLEIQESKKEMVTNLAKMMVERLTLYKSKNKNLPQRILVYRDGVSEGQFNTVVQEELPEIRLACRKFDTPQAPYRPKITIVICVSVPSISMVVFIFIHHVSHWQGKRHHTRFYPTEEANADQNGNPKAGTVVDRGVTSVYNFDFFLQGNPNPNGI